MKYKRYPSYKPSGVEWLGEIPDHWGVRRLKFITSVVVSNVDKHMIEGERLVRLCNYTDVYKNDQITADLQLMEATASAKEIEKFSLYAGDVIVTKDSEDWRDIAVPAFVPRSLDGIICGYHLAIIRPKPSVFDGRYLYWLFSAPLIRYQFEVSANGVTRFGLPNSAIGDGVVTVPPLNEQRAIAAFLNTRTALTDSFLKKLSSNHPLLHEHRRALVEAAIIGRIDVREAA